ncbi:MAG: nitrilase-related carbon-nitrogen hydrolase [Wenzhouxiangellaceae bacterium]|nr:nitrilase-related carbon-nitrogen hydrolase [Wenzhouxiangellaceae bacterium]
MPDKSRSENPIRWRCALVQADTRWADPGANRENLARLMDAAPGCELYVLPETCTTGFLGDREHLAELADETDLRWLEAEARRREAAIACSIVAAEGERIFNRFVLAAPDGVRATYDKRHLFGFGGEDRRYTSGDRRVRTELFGRRVDLQVCYDLRFPVWCRNDDGFDIQIFVANWPRPRVEHWRTLLKARAIENQAFVIGVNRVGTDGNGVEHTGSSGAWDALGEALAGPLDHHEQVAVCELDFGALAATREKFPFLADRDAFSLK